MGLSRSQEEINESVIRLKHAPYEGLIQKAASEMAVVIEKERYWYEPIFRKIEVYFEIGDKCPFCGEAEIHKKDCFGYEILMDISAALKLRDNKRI